jgi:hypothetical protein
MLNDRDIAEDAVQETLVVTWRDLPGLRDPDRFEAWVHQILVRTVYRVARRERRHLDPRRFVPAESRVLPDLSIAVADADEIDRGFRSLTPEHRAVLVVKHYLGLTACRSRVDCGQPLKGGLRITFTGWACTSGFLARDEATDQIVLVTAGHCLVSAGLPAGWSHAYVKIGQGVRAAFADGSRSDAGDIATSESGPRNMLFGSAPGDVRALTSVRSGDLQPVGTPVCRSGGSSGWACGSVTRVDVDVTLRGAAVRHTWWTNFPSAEGDSGAPVVDGDGRLAGIVIATTPTESVYLTADAVSIALGVRPCLDAGCH